MTQMSYVINITFKKTHSIQSPAVLIYLQYIKTLMFERISVIADE